MLASPSAMLARASAKMWRSGCSSRFSRRARPEPGLASQRSARSFAITTAQSMSPARQEKGAASRSGCPPPRPTHQRRARGEPVAPPRLGQGETVLIVHDDRDSLLGDEEILAALGYEPIGFDRPADAIAAVRSEPARFDAVLISMASVRGRPRSGAHASRASVRRSRSSLRDPALDIGVDALVRAGVADLVRRPLVGAELASVLLAALPRRRHRADATSPLNQIVMLQCRVDPRCPSISTQADETTNAWLGTWKRTRMRSG